MKVLIALVQKSVSTEARKLVKSQTLYISVPSVQKNPDVSAVPSSKPSDSTAKASPPITNLPIPSSPSVVLVSKKALASPDFFLFVKSLKSVKLRKDSPTKTNNSITKAENILKVHTTSHREVLTTVPENDNICTHQSALKPFDTAKLNVRGLGRLTCSYQSSLFQT
ncbi:hypothetical protein AVEN_192838-1 [Araneus ventricosus]|uniref:Uncharacterized protein n=1 Tax=Araneus ventricosus TaxID=182803 RepID=A0A4Y2QBU2_ARAVE|nr:hypothetical protein AVEN_91446-1 [Araneus ventricosus]GBN60702.1 hypothetical protein AVEN_192838-1 [Araneus ventricosus]